MSEKITYKDSGVDIELADRVIGSLSDRIKATFRPEVAGKMGGFAALFRPDWRQFKDPMLVSTTDGVGTKLKIAFLMGVHHTVGRDLVAMNANDLLVMGAEPLFFLDYLATGSIEPNTVRSVISGIADGCEEAGCALIGGETAEMPDFYPDGEYDLAGFCVGIVDQPKVIDGSAVKPSHVVIGIASSGLHSNGFSLVRKVLFEVKGYTVNTRIAEIGKPLGEELLVPTTIYVKPVLNLCSSLSVSGMAHITGGGFIGNLPRILPSRYSVVIRIGSWDIPPIFRLIRREAKLDDDDMYRTFNMGIGYVVIVPPDSVDPAVDTLRRNGLKAWPIGHVKDRTDSEKAVVFAG